MTRRLQFSLRGLFVSTLLVALVFGWIEQARRRGRAVDAVVRAGSVVVYDWDSDSDGDYLRFDGENASHFWQDVKRVPVIIDYQGFTLDDSLARNIKAAVPIASLGFWHPVRDVELRRLHGLAGPCDLFLHDWENISADAVEEFEKRSPNVHIYDGKVFSGTIPDRED